MTNEEIGILILAAGSSSRMGISKQMLPVDGISLLGKTITTALQTGYKNVVVVLGSNADEHRIAANEFPVTTILNHEWRKGLGTSVKAGVRYFKNQPLVKGVVILVCDQPKLTSGVILDLIAKQKQTNQSIVASRYGGTLGVPALFMSDYFDAVLTLQDDHGAKRIILQHQDHASVIDFPSGEIDLDTREDYDNFLKNQ